jgi:DNA repair protein RadC
MSNSFTACEPIMIAQRSGASADCTRRTKIKDWPEGERPREKMLRHGPHSLSDAELLAILIRAGTGNQTALDVARQILVKERNLRKLAGKNASELMQTKGIGSAKAVELLAAFEIGRRVEGLPGDGKLIVRSPDDVARLMIPKLRDSTKEKFIVLLLDSKNGVQDDVEVTIGTLNASLVHPREVYKVAIDRLAASIIVVHNHPSGNSEPSKEDLEITRQLVDAGRLIGIPLHDHVIVGGDTYVSFAERGLL